jgi:hypothetical protein
MLGVIVEAFLYKYDYDGNKLGVWNHIRCFSSVFFTLKGLKLFWFNMPGYLPYALSVLAEALITQLAFGFMFKWIILSFKVAYRLCCFKGKEIAYNPFHKYGASFVLYEMMISMFYGLYFYILLGFTFLYLKMDFSEPLINSLFGAGYLLFLYSFVFMWVTTVKPRYVILSDSKGQKLPSQIEAA